MTDVQKADIIRLRSEGQSFGKIAAALELSVNTVKSFCSRNKDSRLCYCCGTLLYSRRTPDKRSSALTDAG